MEMEFEKPNKVRRLASSLTETTTSTETMANLKLVRSNSMEIVNEVEREKRRKRKLVTMESSI